MSKGNALSSSPVANAVLSSSCEDDGGGSGGGRRAYQQVEKKEEEREEEKPSSSLFGPAFSWLPLLFSPFSFWKLPFFRRGSAGLLRIHG